MLNAQKVETLMKMPIPEDLKQLRSFLGDLSYCRKLLRDMATVSYTHLTLPTIYSV